MLTLFLLYFQHGLSGALEQIHACTGDGFIFIIDERDCVFRLAKERKEIQKNYLDFLRGLFKGVEYVDPEYMTGVLLIKNMKSILQPIFLMNIP